MFELRNWSVDCNGLSGCCFGNPNYPDGHLLHVGAIRNVFASYSGLIAVLVNGSKYQLRFDSVNVSSINDTSVSLLNLGFELDVDKCITLWITQCKTKEIEVKKLLSPECMYICMIGTYAVLYAWYLTKNGKLCKAEVTCNHSSYGPSTIGVSVKGVCDFRFFQYPTYIKQFHWSEHLDKVYIENQGFDFEFMNDAACLCPKDKIVFVTNNVKLGSVL